MSDIIHTKEDLLRAARMVEPYVHRTPILTSATLNSISGAHLYFKCENFQKMGAFKMRGAVHAILNLSEDQKAKGVITHSSGNFAQAIALSAQMLGVKAYIVMPENAPEVKKSAVRGYGGQITLCPSTIEARQETVDRLIADNGATFIHPSNDDQVILGNSTLAKELIEDIPQLEYIMAPVGGGGLIAGVALAAHHFGANCKTIGAEPSVVDDAKRSLLSGKIEYNETTDTIADGLKTHLGDRNFPIIQQLVEDIILVEEDEIVSALKLVMERMKVVIEPSAAVGVAAVIKEKERFKGKKVGIVLCGGNLDFGKLPF
jgi:threonine dehydratase